MSFPDLFRILQVVFGIGLVIFVHEAGHFFAARMCGVRVDVFSLGFGPRLVGWRRGATLYQIAAIPIGGYVRMAGELPDGSGRAPAPDELHSKSVAQRFFIYSGGVLMNVAFALVVFPMVLAAGVPVLEPVIATPLKGSPAWHAELPAGTRILTVDGEEIFDFIHIPSEVALAKDGPVQFDVLLPGASAATSLAIEPEYQAEGGFRQIGVRLGVDPSLTLTVKPDSPAAAAGLIDGDRLIGVQDGWKAYDPVEQLEHAFGSGGPIRLLVGRGHGGEGGGQEEELVVVVTPGSRDSDRRFFGIATLSNRVGDQRPDPWLARLAPERGERVVAVDGAPIASRRDFLSAITAPGEGLVVEFEGRTVSLPDRPTLEQALQMERDLLLDFDPASTRIHVQPGQAAAAAGLLTGDRILAIGGKVVGSWQEIYKETRRAARSRDPVVVRYERLEAGSASGSASGNRGGDERWTVGEVSVTPAPMVQPVYGFALQAARGIYRTHSVGESMRAGMTASWRFLTDAWLTLKKMAMGRVSTENLGGIITIGAVSYDWASQGWAKLFFFLCMLSINLAFLNVLPIPVLDGGHLFFCIVEAIKGSPVSERTLGYSQIVGLVLILTLMIYVTYQDVLRILPRP